MPLLVIIAALGAVVLWGASPVASKIAVASLSPLAVTVLRTALGGMAALPTALVLGIRPPATAARRWLLLASAIGGFIGFPLLFNLGIVRTSANHASLILAGLPILTGGISLAADRSWPLPRWWLGCAVALLGEIVLISERSVSAGAVPSSLFGDALVVASAVFASCGYVAGGRLQRAGYPSTGTTFWGAALATVLLLPVLPWALPSILGGEVTQASWLAVLYLAFGVTILGYVLWYWALGKGDMERVALFQFLQPVSGVLLAALLLGERLTLTIAIAAALVLSGVWLAMRGRRVPQK